MLPPACSSFKSHGSGTTAVVVLYRDDRVWVANAGDSRAVLASKEREALAEGSNIDVEPTRLVCPCPQV